VSEASEGALGVTEFQLRLGRCLDDLRPVLVVRHGVEVGAELHADVSRYAWEHRERLAGMQNPAGYLYRVAQSQARRYRRWQRTVDLPPERPTAELTSSSGPPLDRALVGLTADERTVVVLVHAYSYSYGEVAELLGISHDAVRNRLHRAMAKLRRALGEN
jgi:RNA polymerase sigma factor (sigma-70 family)